MSNKKLLFVTGNDNKINEAWMYLSNYDIEKAWVEVPEIQSVKVTEVIKEKLNSAFSQTESPCFVMDASLVINGMCDIQNREKNFPWALIKDVFRSMGAENIAKIVQITNDKRCQWKSILGYHDGVEQHFFEESVDWNIADVPRWTNGYDWDTIFIPKWESRTFAEMSPEEKQQYALTRKLYTQFWNFLEKK